MSKIDYKKRLKTHFLYSWWKYALALTLSLFGVSLAFDMTAYRSPEDKKTELYILNGYCDTEALQRDLWPLLQAECPEQEELTSMNINLLGDDVYVRMQYMTYIAAHQGDVFLMPEAEFRNLMSEEGAEQVYVELTPYIESGIIDPGDIDLTAGYAADSNGQTGLYAIPADSLTGFSKYLCNPEKSVLAIVSYGGNLDTAAHLIGIMLRALR